MMRDASADAGEGDADRDVGDRAEHDRADSVHDPFHLRALVGSLGVPGRNTLHRLKTFHFRRCCTTAAIFRAPRHAIGAGGRRCLDNAGREPLHQAMMPAGARGPRQQVT
jgi:hypothetical protein